MGAQIADGGDAGGHGERIAAERAGLVDGPERRELIHDVGAAAEGADGQAAADDLAEGGEVGADAVEFLRSAEGHAEAGHDFVEDEQRAVLRGERAQGFEVAGRGRDAARVADDGLDDDGGDLLRMCSKATSTAATSL